MLYLAIRIQQKRTDDPYLRPLPVLEQYVQPILLQDLDIVVQEQEIFPVSGIGRPVVEARPVERLGDIDDVVGYLATLK